MDGRSSVFYIALTFKRRKENCRLAIFFFFLIEQKTKTKHLGDILAFFWTKKISPKLFVYFFVIIFFDFLFFVIFYLFSFFTNFCPFSPTSRSSNFKRQNTIDSATIKENTARLSAQNQRPASATHKLLTTQDTCKWCKRYIFNNISEKINIFLLFSLSLASSHTAISSPKPRYTPKYDPTNSSNRPSATVSMMPRRSTTLYEKTSSTEKTNAISTDSKYVYVEIYLSIYVIQLWFFISNESGIIFFVLCFWILVLCYKYFVFFFCHLCFVVLLKKKNRKFQNYQPPPITLYFTCRYFENL